MSKRRNKQTEMKFSKSELLDVAQNLTLSLEFGTTGDNVQVLFEYDLESFYTNRDLEL